MVQVTTVGLEQMQACQGVRIEEDFGRFQVGVGVECNLSSTVVLNSWKEMVWIICVGDRSRSNVTNKIGLGFPCVRENERKIVVAERKPIINVQSERFRQQKGVIEFATRFKNTEYETRVVLPRS
ncbi:hypothetical protein PIB30_016205 [Stylosanthes scabra]|uniref:Uncharacterized protein n=1 Tax=Stylosanthes scabra TaxID=79078 RepID=A0ABU6V8W6_9FABA|nr:hypothetical protein [Stylosanthes scabra]